MKMAETNRTKKRMTVVKLAGALIRETITPKAIKVP